MYSIIQTKFPHFTFGRLKIPEGFLVEESDPVKLSDYLYLSLICWDGIQISLSIFNGIKLDIEFSNLEVK